MQSEWNVTSTVDGDPWPGARRRRRRWPWLVSVTVVLIIAGLLAYHALAGRRLAPITADQMTGHNADLGGSWTGDGVVLTFEGSGAADYGSGEFSYSYTGSPVYGLPSWIAPFGWGPEEGTWSISNLPHSEDAVIDLDLSLPSVSNSPDKPGPSITLSLVGDPANPTMVCQHPIALDPCTLHGTQ
jgi:hypothetical protein